MKWPQRTLVQLVLQNDPPHAEAGATGATLATILSSKKLSGPDFVMAYSMARNVESVKVFIKYPPLSYCNMSRQGNR